MRLVATSAGQTLSFPLRQGSTLIGRHTACHICIPSKTLSRRHCQCYVDGPSVTLRDLGSSHGTFVNGKRVERAELRQGDVISLGSFELRFDAEGAVPAYGHGAGGAEDIVVTATPTGTEMPAGPQHFRGEAAREAELVSPSDAAGVPPQPLDADLPPPAPTDFPDSPSGDDTPADQSFMPVAYTPRKETVLGGGAGDQPQLVVREGRWFLRDPRTGREVEIAPTGAGAAAAAVARPAEARRPNTRLLVTVIGIAAILVITFAASFFRSPRRNGAPVQISDAAWAQIVDPGVDELKKGNYAQAIARFNDAHAKRPKLEAARILADYALLRQTAGADFTKLNKAQARVYLDSIENLGCPSAKARAYVSEQRDWIVKESLWWNELEKAKGQLTAAGGSEDALREVITTLQQIPPDTCAAGPAKEMIADVHQTIATVRLRRADREKAQLQWAKAVSEYQAARVYVADPALTARIDKDVEDCRRYALEDGYIRQAQSAIGSQNLDEAERILRLIKAGYYYERAQQMLASIKNMRATDDLKRRREEVRSLYESGAPPEAIEEAIKRNKLEGDGEFRQMAERARRILALLAEAKKADDEELWREAEDKYAEAVGVEGDAKNDYNRRAQRLVDAMKARYPEIAARLAEKGYRLINKDPVQARKFFDQALKYEADNKRAQNGLSQLDSQARQFRNAGYIHFTAKRFRHAKEAYERARDCAAPGSPLYQGIMQDLQRVLDELGE